MICEMYSFTIGTDPSLSADGRYLAFTASSSVPDDEDPQGGPPEQTVYRYDRLSRTYLKVSVLPRLVDEFRLARAFRPSIRNTGRYVAFSGFLYSDRIPSNPRFRLRIYVRDLVTGTTELVNVRPNGEIGPDSFPLHAAISGDGRYVAFSDFAMLIADDLFRRYIFVYDRLARVTRRASEHSLRPGVAGADTHPAISADGKAVTFTSSSSSYAAQDFNGTTDVFVYVGRRRFDVDINGERRMENLDVFAAVGARSALVTATEVEVTDGRVDILFRHRLQNPMVSAVEIVEEYR